MERLRDRPLRAAREPLVHFVIAGAALFACGAVYHSRIDPHRIVVTRAHVAQLASNYALQFGAPPDAATLNALVARDTHDEILFRQGKIMKLDQDDEIVRRRISQKMQFLLQDLQPPPEPTVAQLEAFYANHSSSYAKPQRVTFTHIYFAADEAGEASAKAHAARVLASLSDRIVRAPERGNAFPDLYDFADATSDQIYRTFGRSAFAEATLTAPVGHWVGPFRSGYGWHLLRVEARQRGGRSDYAQVRDQVRADYLESVQDAANQTAYATLARDYTVVRQDRERSR